MEVAIQHGVYGLRPESRHLSIKEVSKEKLWTIYQKGKKEKD